MPTSRSNKPRLIITIGDPSGIGPEVTLKALASRKIPQDSSTIQFIGDLSVIKKTEKDLNLKLNVPLLDIKTLSPIAYINKAIEMIKKNEADALVTAPVNKYSIRSQGLANFEGHTEYLAEHTGTEDFAMMFFSKDLKITLVTRHIALKDVAGAITAERIYKAVMLTYNNLKSLFRIKSPRIGVAGLNPHAGENGLFGDEEEKVILPAIKKASQVIKDIKGPIPPDVLFFNAINKKYDAVIAMYHDQGLIPFKMLHFKDGVNVTLGLPFIRTSPDHGTAFDIAGKGIADPRSMIEAIKLASTLAGKR